MVKLLKQLFQSLSGNRKSQMMIIDSIVSYLIFAIFLLYISEYILNFMQPFSESVDFDINYKNAEALKSIFIKSSVSDSDLVNFCNYSSTKILSSNSNYEIKSIILPFNDDYYNNSDNEGIFLLRNGNSLFIDFNTNSSVFFDLIIYSENNVYFNNLTYSEYNYFNKTIYTNKVSINIFSNSTLGKNSYELIVNDSAFVFFNNYNYNNIFVSDIPFFYDCGNIRISENKEVFSSIADFNNKNMLVSYNVEVWLK